MAFNWKLAALLSGFFSAVMAAPLLIQGRWLAAFGWFVGVFVALVAARLGWYLGDVIRARWNGRKGGL